MGSKFIWFDEQSVTANAKEAEWSKPSCFRSTDDTTGNDQAGATTNVDRCCVNPWYLLRCLWRFSYIVTRFCILSLVWSVMGGAFIGIFLALSYILWVIMSFIAVTKERNLLFLLLAMLIAIPSLAASPAIRFYY